MSPLKSQKKYTQNYRKKWEVMREFKEWLKPYPDNRTKAVCQVCHTVIKAHLCDLRKHGASKKHKKGMQLSKTLNQLRNSDDIGLDLNDTLEDDYSDDEEAELNEKWNNQAIDCLIRLVTTYWSDFKDGLRKKKDIFVEIASSMAEQSYSFTGEECSKKFRNIKLRYYRVLEKAFQGKETRHRIHYFQDIHELLRDEEETLSYFRDKKLEFKLDPDQYISTISEAKEDPISIDSLQDIGTEDDTIWSEPATTMFLEFLLEFENVLSGSDDDCKYPMWQTISKHMYREGFQVDEIQCFRKWYSMVEKCNNLKNELERNGILPLWPYFMRVKHIMDVVKFPDKEPFEKIPLSIVPRKRVPNKRKIMHQESENQASESDQLEEEIAEASSKRQNRDQTMIRRIQRLGENAEVWERLNNIENSLIDLSDLQEQQRRTNDLLSQILNELSTLSSHISPKNHNFREGSITLIVPQTDI